MAKKRMIVTGGSGKVGHWVIKHLLEEGYDVVNVDVRAPAEALCRHLTTDLTELGQVIDAFSPHATGNRAPYAGVIHMAAIPRPQMHPNSEVWRVNTQSTYNVLEACGLLGIRKVVLGSSESSYGLCFANELFEPKYLPLDEAHPQLPEDTYGLSKVVNETTAAMFHRRDGTQILSYRIGNVLAPEDHERVRARFDHPEERLRILWSYIDARDLAIACRQGIERDNVGCEPLIIAADDTSSNLPSRELIKRFLPGVKHFRAPLPERKALIANDRLKEVLGWRQRYHLL
ncbi:MAG: UDP-glucose 4-epimerase [Pseudomonadota bacterium]|jgi:nucleoside-diphosphate-sugar epimerase